MEDELSSLFQDSKAEPGKTPHVVTFADLPTPSDSNSKASNENIVPTGSRKRKARAPAGKKVKVPHKKRAGERTIKYPEPSVLNQYKDYLQDTSFDLPPPPVSRDPLLD